MTESYRGDVPHWSWLSPATCPIHVYRAARTASIVSTHRLMLAHLFFYEAYFFLDECESNAVADPLQLSRGETRTSEASNRTVVQYTILLIYQL